MGGAAVPVHPLYRAALGPDGGAAVLQVEVLDVHCQDLTRSGRRFIEHPPQRPLTQWDVTARQKPVDRGLGDRAGLVGALLAALSVGRNRRRGPVLLGAVPGQPGNDSGAVAVPGRRRACPHSSLSACPAAFGCGGVDVLIQRPQAGAGALDAVGDLFEHLHRAAEPVQLGEDQDVADAQRVEGLVECGAAGQGAADRVDVGAVASGGLQSVALGVGVWVAGRDTSIAKIHDSTPLTDKIINGCPAATQACRMGWASVRSRRRWQHGQRVLVRT
ncbi:hypothetical protein B0I32_117238 [Nonomuraea fuscirosea]|uniref:Uncharacterized protein n=1 Tax=Nonomuraea fuscirosea TaxID=1291556 RepID=A0A2T0MQQ0_9ACTN|nr:hypothetical protein B0I32_117238 [Nonomuraea fuscirosea]